MTTEDGKYEYEADTFGWRLHEWRDTTDKEGEPKRTKRTTYHGNLLQVFDTILDRECGNCTDVEVLRALLIAAQNYAVERLRELEAKEVAE